MDCDVSEINSPQKETKLIKYEENKNKLYDLIEKIKIIESILPSNKFFSNKGLLINIIKKVLIDLKIFEEEYIQEFLKDDSVLTSTVDSQLSALLKIVNDINSFLSGVVVNASDTSLEIFFQELAKKTFILKRLILDFIASSQWAREVYKEGFENSLRSIQGVLSEIDKTREFILNKKTRTIYSEARKLNEKNFNKNQRYFFLTLAITLAISILLFATYKYEWIKMDIWDYVLIKVIFLAVGITLITYFLRHASIYRKKADQAEQTHLELTAFPSYVIGMDPQELSTLKKDLAMKYFGKEIETEPYNKMGDLVQEQLKVGLEMMKASSEMMKNMNAGNSSKPQSGDENK